MNDSNLDHGLLNAFKAVRGSDDEAILHFIRGVSFSGMSLGLTLAILQLEAQNIGSMEAVLSLLREHRDQWRHAAETNEVEET